MDSFEVIVKEEKFRVIHNNTGNFTFSVFNHATCHIIQKTDFGLWKAVEHRFGADSLPLNEIGEAIDKHYSRQSVDNL